LAKGDRKESLRVLDVLVREGEYLPLVLTFLGGLFRYALAAREAGLRSASDVESHFRRQGVAMWRARAEQIWQVGARLNQQRLEEAIHLAYLADKGLKGSRPDDRTMMEDFVLRLTA
jgi:DNA polymerase III subunit delta